MRLFAVGDIHGRYDDFIEALKSKGFDFSNPNHIIVLCGDVFDRGHQPRQLIDFILKYKNRIIYVRGNHEDLMQNMINRNFNFAGDISNGTTGTIIDLCPEWQVSRFDLKEIAKETGLQDVLNLTVDYYETSKYIFVHSWIPIVDGVYLYDKNWRKANKERWESARWVNPLEMYHYELFEPNKTIVFGHWHCSAFWHDLNPKMYDEFGDKECFDPFITKDIIALDSCSAHTHKVNVIVLEDC